MKQETFTLATGANVVLKQGVMNVVGYEVSEAILDAARNSGRPLIRLTLRVGDEVSEEEKAAIMSAPLSDAEKTTLLADLARLKGQPISQLVTLDDLGITAYTKAPTEPTQLASWNYFDAGVQAILASKPKIMLVTVFFVSIPDLLVGAAYAEGVTEDGKPVKVTGVENADTGRVYSTLNRVYFGFNSDYTTAYQTIKNGLLRDVADGTITLGANDAEKQAVIRKLQAQAAAK